MPMMNGLELTSRLGSDFPGIKTIILSMHSDKEYIGLRRSRPVPSDT